MKLGSCCYLGVIVLELFKILWGLVDEVPRFIFLLEAILVIPALLLSWKVISKPNKFVIVMALASGMGLLGWHGSGWNAWLDCITHFVDIAVVLTVLGLLAFPFRQGRYGELLIKSILRLSSRKMLIYLFITIVMTLMASLILFPALPLVYYLIAELPLDKNERQLFLGTVLTRGYVPAIMWTPFSIVMLLSIGITKVSWFKIAPYGLMLTALGLLLPLLYQRQKLAGHLDLSGLDFDTSASMSSRSLIVTVIGLLLGLILLGMVPRLDLIAGLTLITILFPMIWSGVTSLSRAWAKAVYSYFLNEFPIKCNEASLFVALGFFSGAIQTSGAGQILQKYFSGFVENTGLLGFVLIIPALIVLLSMAGINNVVGIVLVGTILTPAVISIDPKLLCILLVLGGSLSIIVSPFSIITIVTCSLLNVSNYTITRWNLGYVTAYFLLGAFLLILLFR